MQVGAENIRLGWPVPLSGGSPILGYHVDMEALQPARAELVAFSEAVVPSSKKANGDGSWERIYDGPKLLKRAMAAYGSGLLGLEAPTSPPS